MALESMMRRLFAGAVLAAVAVAVPGCVPASAQEIGSYCAKVGNDDRLQALPPNLIGSARRVFEIAAEMPDAFIMAGTSVRCMGGTVWLCNRGANLVCEKADVSRKSAGAERYCKQDPNAMGVPMSATGHATIYDWKCVGGKAVIAGQIAEVDARGFIADNWKPLK
jgi:hypothetical protein